MLKTRHEIVRLLLIIGSAFGMALSINAQPIKNGFPWTTPTTDARPTDAFPRVPESPAGLHGFLLASSPDAHFHFADGARIRFWGTTIGVSAAFPDSVDAIAQAAHLQKYGFNLVRFYGFDAYWEYGVPILGIFKSGLIDSTTQHFDSAQMRRMDWFIYQLKLHGIYVDFTFNVYRGFRSGDGVNRADSISIGARIVKYYDPRIQELERQFAEMLMTHVNEYTGLAYKDDPSIAMIEFTDQDPLMSWMVTDDVLRTDAHHTLSLYQSHQLDTLFNSFLQKKYGTSAALTTAWNPGSVSSANLIQNGSFEKFSQQWTFQAVEGNSGDQVFIGSGGADSTTFVRVVITSVDNLTFGIILANQTATIYRDSLYQVSFYAKTPKIGGRKILVGVNAGFYQYCNLDTVWKHFSFVFRAATTELGSGAVAFYLSSEMGDVMIDGVVLQRSREYGLDPAEHLENASVQRVPFAVQPYLSDARMKDLSLFYDSLSRSYCATMHQFLRTIGVRIPIAGINVAGMLGDVRSEELSDFVASTTQWDNYVTYTNDSMWTITNYSIVKNRWGPLTRPLIGALRSKPLVISQYAQIYPNAYQTESMLHVPGYAALQDYDGVIWQYYAADKSKFGARQITKGDMYELMHNPAMMALMPAASAMFRQGEIKPALNEVRIQHDTNDALLAPKYAAIRSGGFGVVGQLNTGAMFVRRMRIDSMNANVQHTSIEYDMSGADSTYVESDTKELRWDAGALGIMSINAPRAQGATGFLRNATLTTTRNCSVARLDSGNFGTYLWTALDTMKLDSARMSLLVLSARGQNTGMRWNTANTSVGNSWGGAPTILEPMKLAFNFTTGADTMLIYPLDSIGRRFPVPIGATRNYRGEWRVTIDQSVYKTPWYLVEQTFRDTAASTVESSFPITLGLSKAYPEPFREHATIRASGLRTGNPSSFLIYDHLGRIIADYTDQLRNGYAIDIDGTTWSAGVYRCVYKSGDQMIMRSIVHLP